MEGFAALGSLLILLLLIFNFIDTLRKRKKLGVSLETNIDKVHSKLQIEVARQIKDGYKLVSVEANRVKLIKKKRYWFPLWLFFLMPNSINIIFSASFLCNIYGVELTLVGDVIEISTF